MPLFKWMAAHTKVWRRATVLLALCIAVAAIASSAPVHAVLVNVLRESKDVIEAYPTAGAFLFVACAALSAMLAFVSVAVIVPIAVFTWGAASSAALLWIGWILGGMLSYAAGHAFGRPLLGWAISAATLRKFQTRVHRGVPFSFVVLLQIALPSEIPGYLLGAAGYRFDRYLLALAIAELPYAAITIYLGESLVQNRGVALALGGAGLVIAGLGAVYLLQRSPLATELRALKEVK